MEIYRQQQIVIVITYVMPKSNLVYQPTGIRLLLLLSFRFTDATFSYKGNKTFANFGFMGSC